MSFTVLLSPRHRLKRVGNYLYTVALKTLLALAVWARWTWVSSCDCLWITQTGDRQGGGWGGGGLGGANCCSFCSVAKTVQSFISQTACVYFMHGNNRPQLYQWVNTLEAKASRESSHDFSAFCPLVKDDLDAKGAFEKQIEGNERAENTVCRGCFSLSNVKWLPKSRVKAHKTEGMVSASENHTF